MKKALLIWEKEETATTEIEPVSVTVQRPEKLNFEVLDSLFLDKELAEILENNCPNTPLKLVSKPGSFSWPPKKTKKA